MAKFIRSRPPSLTDRPPSLTRGNARLKLDRLGVAFGEAEGADERRATDRFGFDEMNRARRCQFRRRRAQRFNGPRAHSACSA